MRLKLLATALLASAQGAVAAPVQFSGTFANQNPPAAVNGRCAPAARTVSFGPGIAPVSGSSNLGDFIPNGSHCINPPLPKSYFDGVFTFDFGLGDVLTGTYSGTLSATPDPSRFANVQDFIVTGGTGRFAGFGGSFQGVGTVVFAPASPPSSTQTLRGTLTAPVPEPGTWAMMIAGFALTGVALRRRSPDCGAISSAKVTRSG
jgi:hypothetical protein